MRKRNSLKKQLGENYNYEKSHGTKEIFKLLNRCPTAVRDTILATLTVGCLRLDAVLFVVAGKLQLCYEVLVKDHIDSPNWVCYDNISMDRSRVTKLYESAMFELLDNYAEQHRLSYTECNFEILDGKSEGKPE